VASRGQFWFCIVAAERDDHTGNNFPMGDEKSWHPRSGVRRVTPLPASWRGPTGFRVDYG
jgi:hypothetical protein